MAVDVTKPMEVVALPGAEEPEGTVWGAEFCCSYDDGDIKVDTAVDAFVFNPDGSHWLGKPYRLRNKAADITAGRKVTKWEARFHAALGSQNEKFRLMKLAAETAAKDEPVWTLFYDLADGTFDDDRTEALEEIQRHFFEWEAEEEFDEAQREYERIHGEGSDGEGSPAFDELGWKREYVDRAITEYRSKRNG